MSHEIRTPLTAIVGMTELALDRQISEPVDVRGLRVLVVDDNATNRRIVAEMLTSWHMRPQAVGQRRSPLEGPRKGASDGRPAQARRAGRPDARMDGFELARRIKHDRRFETMPMIMLPSMGRPGDAARWRKVGVSAYLTKPARHSDLLDAIVLLCGARGRQAATSDDAGGGEDVPSATMHARLARQAGAGRALRVLLAEDNVVNRRLVQASSASGDMTSSRWRTAAVRWTRSRAPRGHSISCSFDAVPDDGSRHRGAGLLPADQQRQGRKAEHRSGVERVCRAEAVPQPARTDARHQHEDATGQVEEPIGGTTQV